MSGGKYRKASGKLRCTIVRVGRGSGNKVSHWNCRENKRPSSECRKCYRADEPFSFTKIGRITRAVSEEFNSVRLRRVVVIEALISVPPAERLLARVTCGSCCGPVCGSFTPSRPRSIPKWTLEKMELRLSFLVELASASGMAIWTARYMPRQ